MLGLAVGLASCSVNNSGLGGGSDGAAASGGGSGSSGGRGGASGGAGVTGLSGATGGPGVGGVTGGAGTSGAGGTATAGQTGTAGSLAGGAGTTGAAGLGGASAGSGAGGSTAGTSAGGTSPGGTTGGSNTGGAGTAAGGTTGGSAAGGSTAGSGAGTSGGPMGGRGGAGMSGGCGPSSCPNGCCRNNACITNLTNQNCGTAGVQCAPCGDCLRCGNAGVCEANPNSDWTVLCVSAEVSPTRPDGMVWDPNGATTNAKNPDPYCQLTTGDNRTRSTSTDGDTLMPYWNDTVSPIGGLSGTVISSPSNSWTVAINDQDNMVGSNEIICSVSPHPTAAELTSGTMVISSGSCTRITLELYCND